MQIKDIKEVKTLLEKTPTSSLFFFKDADKVSNIQILSALMRIPDVNRDEAIAVAKAVKPPPPRVLVDDFLEFLSLFSVIKRKAILFALEQNLTLEEVVLFKWEAALKLKLTSTGREILLSLPRHLFTNFAFWEYGDAAEARPLMTLISDFGKTAKEDLKDIRKMYHSVIKIHSENDVVELNHLLNSLKK